MGIQLLFVGLFALNILIFWLLGRSNQNVLYRIVHLALFGLIPFVTVFFEQPHFYMDYFWWRVAGVIAMVLGIAIASWAKLEFIKAGQMPYADAKQLIMTGPYKFIRHPQYLGLIFFIVGWWWIWAAIYSFYFGMFILALIWVQAYLEEKMVLEKQFGEQYRDYRLHTGMFWIK
jgi:protein-S-isoprenylcysteine O-methyltransferase Ste14